MKNQKASKILFILLIFNYAIKSQVENQIKLVYSSTISKNSGYLITITSNNKKASFLSLTFELKDTTEMKKYEYDDMIKNGYPYFMTSYTFSNLLTAGLKNGFFGDKNACKKAFANREKNSVNLNNTVVFKSNRISIALVEPMYYQLFLIDAETLNQFEPIGVLKSNYSKNAYLTLATPVK